MVVEIEHLDVTQPDGANLERVVPVADVVLGRAEVLPLEADRMLAYGVVWEHHQPGPVVADGRCKQLVWRCWGVVTHTSIL